VRKGVSGSKFKVSSCRNREDAMRRLLPVAVLLLASVPLAVSAPVPKDERPEKKLERLFGTPIQPDGTRVRLDGNVLKITVPELRGKEEWDQR
jgi:hypothetical protein